MNTFKCDATTQQIMPLKNSKEVNQHLSGTASNNKYYKLNNGRISSIAGQT